MTPREEVETVMEGMPSAVQERAIRALMAGTTHVVALVEEDGTISYVSQAVETHLGRQPEELIGSKFDVFLHPDDVSMAATALAAELTRPGRAEVLGLDSDIGGEYRLLHADGSWVPFEIVRNNLLAEPSVHALLIVARPIWPRFALDEALGVLAYDPDGGAAITKLVEYLDGRLPGTASAVMINGERPEWVGGPVAESLLGGRGPWERATATGESSFIAVGTPSAFDPAVEAAANAAGYEACWSLPVPIREPKVYTRRVVGEELAGSSRASGELTEQGVSGCVVVWSQRELEPPVAYLGTLERVGGLVDLAIKRRIERQRMRRMVNFDHVTGALSRVGLDSMTSGSEDLPRARLLIDLDDFKEVNDRFGHTFGDEVLRVAVKRLNSVLRYQDLLCRLGGDEFLLLVAGGESAQAVAVAERIIAVLDRPVTIGSVSVPVRASIGVAAHEPGVTASQLVERADRAMYAAKRAGKNQWAVWGAD